MITSPLRIDEFRAGVALLPADLACRAEALQLYVTHRPRCPDCERTGDSVRHAFSAAHFGDIPAAERLLTAAERSARPASHATGCGRGGLRSIRGVSGNHGRVTGRWAATELLTAATDASWKSRVCGIGYITSEGCWGLRGWAADRRDPTGASKVLVNELRAVDLLLRAVGRPDVLLVDSLCALSFLHTWQRGDTGRMPDDYDLRPRRNGPPTLVRLAEHVAELDGLTFRHVKGHSGHLLNEAADSLASIARRSVTERFDATGRATGLVSSFLSSWHQRPMAA
ncbi:RNase H family protein [Streptosporangium sp. NPDC087985]|uniref:RNase H family protein n=1 Tax=Streptosporangium sp. NPDC087985 TaxID=3366196 RepID=UPI003805C668